MQGKTAPKRVNVRKLAHKVPKLSLREHVVDGTRCWCRTRFEDIDGQTVIVHSRKRVVVSPLQSGRGARFTRSRASRHQGVDVVALRKRRAKNRVARRSRRVNRIAARR